MRRAFTLIELLTIVAIISVMVTVAVMSVNSGQGVARIRGATRDIYATIRQARSVALVTQQSTVITYSTVQVDGETCARVYVDSVKLMKNQTSGRAQTLRGEIVDLSDPVGTADDEVRETRGANGANLGNEPEVREDGGETIGDILFAPIDDNVMHGIAIKVVVGDEALEEISDEVRKATSSAFSNADSLLSRYGEAKRNESGKSSSDDGEDASSASDDQEPVRVVWEPNGRCEPHQVWVYPAGTDPDKGLAIRVDRFGAAKVISPGEDD